MSALNLVRLIQLLRSFLDLAELPTWSAQEAVRKWFVRLARFAQQAAEIVPGSVDDRLAGVLAEIVADPAKFAALYEVVVAIVDALQNDQPPLYQAPAIAGIDPELVALILELVITVLQELLRR